MKKLFLLVLFGVYSVCLAVTPIDSLLNLVKFEKEDTVLAKNYIRLAWKYYEISDSLHAAFYLHQSSLLSSKIHFVKGELDASNNLAMLYTIYARPDSSLKYLLNGLRISKTLHDANVTAKSCLNVASAYLNRANYASSIQYYLQALDHFEKTKDDAKIAMTDHCIGIAYYLMRNYKLSLSYYNKAIDKAIILKKTESAGYSYNGIGVVYKELGRYDTALYYLEQAHLLALKNDDKTLLSHSLSNLGEIYNIRGMHAKALDYLLQAAKIQLETDDHRGLAETHILTGQLYFEKNNYKAALSSFETARQLAQRAGFTDILKNAWKGESDAYHGLHKDGEALSAYREYSNIKDSLYTSESTKQIAEMQTKYNTEKKEHENTLLQRENDLKSLQLKEQKQQKFTIAILSLFILITMVIFYNRYRLKQKNILLEERTLRTKAVLTAQEEEKEKLSKDLHDGVGSLLSLIKLNISALESASAEEKKIIDQTKDLAGKAITEVRQVSHQLAPGLLATVGLEAALTELTAQINSSGKLIMQLQFENPSTIPREAELNIFRMVQEAVNNIVKHAEATEASIQLSQQNNRMVISIKDNGKGFDQTNPLHSTGNGLRNLSNRAGLLNGILEINSLPGKGTQIVILLSLT
jgi:two-component system NarL family sensor kinase